MPMLALPPTHLRGLIIPHKSTMWPVLSLTLGATTGRPPGAAVTDGLILLVAVVVTAVATAVLLRATPYPLTTLRLSSPL